MQNERVILTIQGNQELHAELHRLKSVDRPTVIASIAEARAHGDLSENAEYDAAKEQQQLIEGRISELEANLSIAEVIDPTKIFCEGKVVFGSNIHLYDTEQDTEVCYQLVGNLEADLKKNRISIYSPIGKALIGKKSGDKVIVNAPSGKRAYKILNVD